MSSIFWYQAWEMCGCLNRNYSLSCSTWGQEGPRPAQTFAGLLGRWWAVPVPSGSSTAAATPTSPQDLRPRGCRFQLPTYIPANMPSCEKMSLSFSKKNVSFFSIPLPPFCIFELQLFKGSLPLQFLPLYRLFLETGEPGGGLKFRGVNCGRSGKLFPLVCSFFLHLSSGDLRGLTPIALLVPGQAEADAFVFQERLLPTRRRAASQAAIASLLLFWVSHLAKKW